MNPKHYPATLAAVPCDGAIALSTDGLLPHERVDYWREMVCRRFAEVQISSRLGRDFSGQMLAHQYGSLRVTHVVAKAQSVSRIAKLARTESEDCYFAVVLLSGCEFLTQGGREARLQPGDISIYDATLPHSLIFPEDFKKLIIQIPRQEWSKRLSGMDRSTALTISGSSGTGAIASGFFQSLAHHSGQLSQQQRSNLSDQALDLLALGLASVAPVNLNLSRSRPVSLSRIKHFIEHQLSNPDLDSQMVADGTALSPRYINQLFEEEGTSLMRYVWRSRLEHCRDDMLNQRGADLRVYDIALRWGFNDPSHFSRAFRKCFGVGPRDFCFLQKTQQKTS
jgi:AraC family transcriptional regulator, positive regulator of tynA and feaB